MTLPIARGAVLRRQAVGDLEYEWEEGEADLGDLACECGAIALGEYRLANANVLGDCASLCACGEWAE